MQRGIALAGAQRWQAGTSARQAPPNARLGALALAGLLAISLGAFLPVQPAAAAVRCRTAAADKTLEVTLPNRGDIGTAIRHGAAIRIRRDLDGRPVTCNGPVPTVTTIDKIKVRSQARGAGFAIDLGGGPLRPGATDTGAGSEIEVDVRLDGQANVFGAFGSSGADNFNFGGISGGGVNGNLIGTRDTPELELHGVEILQLAGRGGPDSMRASGAPGYRRPLVALIFGSGGTGNDNLIAGSGIDFLLGQNGNDSLAGNRSTDVLYGGAGQDRINGGPGNDLLKGQGDRDRLLGGKGGDLLSAGTAGDNDLLNCGPGRDAANYSPGVTLRSCEFKSRSPRVVAKPVAPTGALRRAPIGH